MQLWKIAWFCRLAGCSAKSHFFSLAMPHHGDLIHSCALPLLLTGKQTSFVFLVLHPVDDVLLQFSVKGIPQLQYQETQLLWLWWGGLWEPWIVCLCTTANTVLRSLWSHTLPPLLHDIIHNTKLGGPLFCNFAWGYHKQVAQLEVFLLTHFLFHEYYE